MVSNRVSPLILGLANIEPSTVAGTFVARYEIWDINTMANRTDRTTAAMAVHAGLCKHVLVFRAMNGRSARRPGANRLPEGPGQWLVPFGSTHAAATFGPYYTAYMERFGATTDDLGHVAVTQRAHGQSQPGFPGG